jgi:hypothetical protein
MFWDKKKNVRVVFVDASTGAAFANTDCPPEQLPESFEAHTTVNVQGQDWEVQSAVPVTRAEFMKTGELRLSLRKLNIVKMPPGDILYSLPTICDGIPGIAAGSSKLSKHVLELHEDDWRQIELFSAAHLDEVRACLAKIEGICAKERMPSGGFKNIHLRSERTAPIAGNGLTLSGLGSIFSPGMTAYDGVSYRGVAGLIAGGFGFRTGAHLDVYGIASGGSVTTVGLLLDHLSSTFEADASSLAHLLRANDLVLVDWCRVQVVDGREEHVVGYLRSVATRALP